MDDRSLVKINFFCCKFEVSIEKWSENDDNTGARTTNLMTGGGNSDKVNKPLHKPLPKLSRCSTKKLVGYFTSWGDTPVYYSQLKVLTHIIYAFVEMNPDDSLQIGSPDRAHANNPQKETEKSLSRLMESMNARVNFPDVKIMFAV